MHIEITDETDRKALSRNRWVFWMDAGYGHGAALNCVLDSWCLEERATPRHKFASTGEGYKRRPHDGVVHFGGWRKPAAEVPMPPRETVVSKVVEALTITGPIDPKDGK